jgi:lysophospholipase L1-like esterase
MQRRARIILMSAVLAASLVGPVGSASAVTTRSVTLTVPSTSVVGATITARGTLSRSPWGSTVRIQRRSGTSWVTVKTVRTGSQGRYSARVLMSRSGTQTYRAYAPSTSRLASARSPWRHVVVLKTFTSAPRPSIDGSPEVGHTLTATTGTWSPSAVLGRRWLRDGVPVSGATSSSYDLGADDLGASISVEVVGTLPGYVTTKVVSAATGPVGRQATTFGELMHPASAQVLPASEASVTALDHAPAWADTAQLIRWDTPGAFTHSLDPKPALTVFSANYGQDVSNPALGAEYNTGNITLQNADVSFVVTGRKFAIRYLTSQSSDAMVWIDGVPASPDPIIGKDAAGYGEFNWVEVELPARRTVTVRFAGPTLFTGVDIDQNDPATVSAAPAPFTIGVVADSYYDSSTTPNSYASSAAAVLHTKTGFRVWSLAQYGTGFLNDASAPAMNGQVGYPGYYASPFGSDKRIARLATAPIDALLVNGSVNDGQFFTPAQHLAAVEAYVDRVAEVRPNLPIVLVGIEPVKIGRALTAAEKADYDAKTENLRSMVGRHRNVVGFIDPYTEQWLTGTGSTTSPKGDGNQDQYIGPDGTHLTAAGQDYYQALVKARLADLPATVPTS